MTRRQLIASVGALIAAPLLAKTKMPAAIVKRPPPDLCAITLWDSSSRLINDFGILQVPKDRIFGSEVHDFLLWRHPREEPRAVTISSVALIVPIVNTECSYYYAWTSGSVHIGPYQSVCVRFIPHSRRDLGSECIAYPIDSWFRESST